MSSPIKVKVKLTLRPTVSRPVSLGVRPPSGNRDQFFFLPEILLSQETHYVSATEPSRLMPFGETVAVYCENHTEHTDTVRTSQETSLQSPTG
jgi:hypothetical protein